VKSAAYYSILIAAAGISLSYAFGYFSAPFSWFGLIQFVISGVSYSYQKAADEKYKELHPPEPEVVEGEVVKAENPTNAELVAEAKKESN